MSWTSTSAGIAWLLGLLLLAGCPHLLEMFATDGDGNQRLIANTLVSVVP